MAWLRMPGHSWIAAGAAFVATWVVMMLAMMLPSLIPSLARYRRAVRDAGAGRLGRLTAVVAAGYFAVWAVLGAVLFPLGAALAGAAMHWSGVARAVPTAGALALILAGVVQLSPWKRRRLSCCRGTAGRRPPRRPLALSAWRWGLRLGRDCVVCCVGFIAVLLAAGMMSLTVDILVAAGISAERLLPNPAPAIRAAGALAVVMGIVELGRVLILS